jgi:phosphoribosylformylglycinamidine cyclo-ligase
MPPLFAWLQREGNVADSEMHRVFNCGIGMTVIVAPEYIDAATQLLQSKGETAWRIGTIREQRADEPRTIIE